MTLGPLVLHTQVFLTELTGHFLQEWDFEYAHLSSKVNWCTNKTEVKYPSITKLVFRCHNLVWSFKTKYCFVPRFTRTYIFQCVTWVSVVCAQVYMDLYFLCVTLSSVVFILRFTSTYIFQCVTLCCIVFVLRFIWTCSIQCIEFCCFVLRFTRTYIFQCVTWESVVLCSDLPWTFIFKCVTWGSFVWAPWRAWTVGLGRTWTR